MLEKETPWKIAHQIEEQRTPVIRVAKRSFPLHQSSPAPNSSNNKNNIPLNIGTLLKGLQSK